MSLNKSKKYCRIVTCENNHGTTRTDVPFFRAGNDLNERKNWAHAVNTLYGMDITMFSGIVCGKHFSPEDVIGRMNNRTKQMEYRLKIGAIPTVPNKPIVKTEDEHTFEYVDIGTMEDENEDVEMVLPIQLNENHIIEIETSSRECNKCGSLKLKLLLSNKCNQELNQKCLDLELENDKLKTKLKFYADKYDEFIEKISNEQHQNAVVTTEPEKPSNVIRGFDESSVEKLFGCGKCDSSFQHPSELNRHIKKEHVAQIVSVTDDKKTYYECYICKQKFLEITTIYQHIKKHVAARDEKCEICQETFTSNEIKSHVCFGKMSIACEYCNEPFTSIRTLIQHLDIHDDRKVYRCRYCNNYFGMTCLKDWHENEHKIKSIRRLRSKRCTKRTNSNLDEANSFNFLCSDCGKAFKTDYLLRKHERCHTEILELKCPDCPHIAKSKQLLNYHQDMHRNLKYACSDCTAIFTSKRGLYRHCTRKHMSLVIEKRFHCTFCPLQFEKRSSLRTHLRKHTGEKPFECELCTDRKYTYKQDLLKHMQTYHGINVYKCDQCDESFRLFLDLRQHRFEHYKQEKTSIES